jgi:hypothetical protein
MVLKKIHEKLLNFVSLKENQRINLYINIGTK